MEKVMVCPFCGGEPSIEPWHDVPLTKHMVSCDNAKCEVIPMVSGDTRAIAVKRWNKRADVRKK